MIIHSILCRLIIGDIIWVHKLLRFVLICKSIDFCRCMLLVVCLSLSVFRLWKKVSVKMGGQLDKRMLHWQPATCCIFSCSLLSVTWRIKYYYYYRHNVCGWQYVCNSFHSEWQTFAGAPDLLCLSSSTGSNINRFLVFSMNLVLSSCSRFSCSSFSRFFSICQHHHRDANFWISIILMTTYESEVHHLEITLFIYRWQPYLSTSSIINTVRDHSIA